MFELLPPSGISERLSDAIYKWRGIGQWPETEATVSNVSWTRDPEIRGEGMYWIYFSYSAGGKMQTGTLKINGHESAAPYQQADTFILRFNPKRPSKYYYENVLSGLERAALIVTALGLGAAGAMVMISLFPD
jgi:hypothetical protein